MSGNYKTIFRGLQWDFCYYKEFPWKEIYIDCDSIIFGYMLEYLQYNLVISYETAGANIFSTRRMVDTIIYDISMYSHDKLTSLVRKMENHMKCVMVFGENNIEMKQEQINKYIKSSEDAYKELRSNRKISYINLDRLRESLHKYIKSQRDTIRNIIRSATNEDYMVSEEPDIYCPKHCIVSFSIDYDLFLFGAKYIIRGIDGDMIKFISRDSLLKRLGLYNIRQLVIAAVLCGTDYNRGIRGMDPKKSINIAINNPDCNIIDSKVVDFFINIIKDSRDNDSW